MKPAKLIKFARRCGAFWPSWFISSSFRARGPPCTEQPCLHQWLAWTILAAWQDWLPLCQTSCPCSSLSQLVILTELSYGTVVIWFRLTFAGTSKVHQTSKWFGRTSWILVDFQQSVWFSCFQFFCLPKIASGQRALRWHFRRTLRRFWQLQHCCRLGSVKQLDISTTNVRSWTYLLAMSFASATSTRTPAFGRKGH